MNTKTQTPPTPAAQSPLTPGLHQCGWRKTRRPQTAPSRSAICRTARTLTGARFLSCTFNAQTPVVYARNDTGDPVNYGNLDIDVVITPAGATGIIDFGVFRSGADENEDGLPDSRPDLASIAFQTAAEETGAGVLEFFEMRFVRESPLGCTT